MIQAPPRSGLVRMDQFEAVATWDNANCQSIVVKFKEDLLSKQKRRDLARFRSRTRALLLRVPGREEVQAKIVGFSTLDNAFYLAWI